MSCFHLPACLHRFVAQNCDELRCLQTNRALSTPLVHTPEDRICSMKSAISTTVYSVYTIKYKRAGICKFSLYANRCSQVWTPVDRCPA